MVGFLLGRTAIMGSRDADGGVSGRALNSYANHGIGR